MVRIVRNVHNDRHPEASQNARERCVQSELSVRYVLSAKKHELGYSIIINNSVLGSERVEVKCTYVNV